MELYIINKDGEELDLLNNHQNFILTKAEAMHGVNTDINDSQSPYVDGTFIDMVRTLPRTITLTFNLIHPVKESIDFITKVIKSKQYVTLRQIEGDKEILIKGVATIPPYTRMLSSCKLVLTIYCGQPYWEDAQTIINVIGQTIDLLNFPISGQFFTPIGRPFGTIDTSLIKDFKNEGDVSVGMLIEIYCTGDVSKPRISSSSGEQYGNFMELNLTLHEGDEVLINTTRGNKFITINGLSEIGGAPILSYLNFSGTDWLQLETGTNTFEITTESGDDNIFYNISFKRRYE